jgi:uncharacterized protein (DUF2141 family)
MIRYKFLLLGMFLLCATLIKAQSSLIVEVTNLRSSTGQVSMELLNKDNISVKGKTELIKDNKCIVSFDNLKSGTYAIRYFHDEDSNNELETNFLGIPKEGIGFSNDAYGRFGPKDFEDWLFEFKENTQIKLVTTYY